MVQERRGMLRVWNVSLVIITFLLTIVGTFLGVLLAIVLIFHVWLAKEPDAFVNALWGGAFLSGIALSVACCSSLLGRRSRRHS
jgi:cytochrome c biogenesis factor